MKTPEEYVAAIQCDHMMNGEDGVVFCQASAGAVIAEAMDAARSDGYRAGLEAAARKAEGWPGVFKDGSLVAAAIRALAGKEQSEHVQR